mgnify:CR=1 FL=1
MCGYSNSNDGKIQIYFGAYGSHLKVGNKFYCQSYTEEFETISREEMYDLLSNQYTKEELIELLLQFVDNGEEG